jgi:uncharacterized protein (TIGR00725 family)
MGSHANAYQERARVVGRWIARQGYHLLTGAGEGVMRAVSQAFVEADGRVGCVIGIVPAVVDDPSQPPAPGYPNPWVEIPIYTHLGVGHPAGDEPTSRNHVNVLTSSAIILLPGGEGTRSEARLALRYGTPAVAFLQSRDEIPLLPQEIPVTRDFAEVTDFVVSRVTRGSHTDL